MKKSISIVHKDDLTDYELLCNNPKIIKCITLPYNYILFYFWDPLFDEIFGKTVNDRSHKIYSDSVLKHKAIKLLGEENSLVKPLYTRSTAINFVTALGFVINEEYYELSVLRRDRLIKLGNYFNNKILEPECEITIKFNKNYEKGKLALENVISEWVVWSEEHNMKMQHTNISYEKNEATLSATFVNGYEDAYATLIIMLNVTKNKTGCTFIAFK